MKLKSSQLGEFEIDQARVISFPGGIPGFEIEREYAIFPINEDGPFYYMHAIRNPDLCLVLAITFVFFPDYELELSPEALDILGIENKEPELAVYSVLTIPRDFKEATANLLAPIIVNPVTKKGLQYIAGNSRYQTKHQLFPKQQKMISAQGQGL